MGSCCLAICPFLLSWRNNMSLPLVAGSCPKFSPIRPLSHKEASGCPGQRLLWSTYLWLTETAKQSGCPGGQAQPTPTSAQLSR